MMKAKLKERSRHGIKDNVVVITPQMAGVKKAVNPFAPDTKKRNMCEWTSQQRNAEASCSMNTLEYYWQYVHHTGELSHYDFINCYDKTTDSRLYQVNIRVGGCLQCFILNS